MLSAALFEQLVVSPLAASMGSAVTAYPPGALAIHYNPAGLADIPGTRFDNSIGMAFTYRELTLTQAIDPTDRAAMGTLRRIVQPGKRPSERVKELSVKRVYDHPLYRF